MIKILEENKNLYFQRNKIFPFIVQIGCGGNGTYVTQILSQILSIFDQEAVYLLADPDVVESKNLRNQLFIEQDIGKKKAEVLAKRYSAAYNIRISYYTNSYIEDVKTLRNLFSYDYLHIGYSNEVLYLPVIIGCVDNNFSRKIIHNFFERSERCIYIDVGCESVKTPLDNLERPMEQWSAEEIETYKESGWSGQVVCGARLNGETLSTPIAKVFPEILDDKDAISPSQLACSNVVASDPQRVLCNRMAAMSIAPYLNELIKDATIANHMTFFHAKKGYMRTIAHK